MRNIARRAIFLGLGMLLVASTVARSEEAGDTREQIIQGVRDDVHRKIQERNELPAENRAEMANGNKQPMAAPTHSNTKQDRQDTPK